MEIGDYAGCYQGSSLKSRKTACLYRWHLKRGCLDFPLGRLLVFPQFAHGLLRTMQPRANHPILDFGIEKFTLRYAGSDLQPQKCIPAERDGTLWSANACGGVMQIRPDGSQTLITQKRSFQFEQASSEGARYLRGTLSNGLSFARNGDFLIANFGTDCLEVMKREGTSDVLADTIDGQPVAKANFVLRDSRDRVRRSRPSDGLHRVPQGKAHSVFSGAGARASDAASERWEVAMRPE